MQFDATKMYVCYVSVVNPINESEFLQTFVH